MIGTEPRLISRDNQLVWLYPDGTVLPRVRGGSDAGLPGDSVIVDLPPTSVPGQGGPSSQGNPGSTPPAGYLTEDEVRERLNRARSEERQKLHDQLEKDRAELARLRQAEEERTRREAEAEAQRRTEEDNARRQAEAEELDSKSLIERREAELRAQMEQQRAWFESELATRDAMMEREREFAALETYRAQVTAANEEHILPEFRDLVQGTTREQIDASVADLINRSQAVLANLRQAGMEAGRAAPGVSTRAPAVGPETMAEGRRQLSAEDIRNMSMAEYQQYRSQLPPGRAGGSDRGLF